MFEKPPLKHALRPDGSDVHFLFDPFRLTMLLRSTVIFWSCSCIFRTVDKVSTSSRHSFSTFIVFPSSGSFMPSVKLQFRAAAMLRSCSCKVCADVSSCENCFMKASRASAAKTEQQWVYNNHCHWQGQQSWRKACIDLFVHPTIKCQFVEMFH